LFGGVVARAGRAGAAQAGAQPAGPVFEHDGQRGGQEHRRVRAHEYADEQSDGEIDQRLPTEDGEGDQDEHRTRPVLTVRGTVCRQAVLASGANAGRRSRRWVLALRTSSLVFRAYAAAAAQARV